MTSQAGEVLGSCSKGWGYFAISDHDSFSDDSDEDLLHVSSSGRKGTPDNENGELINTLQGRKLATLSLTCNIIKTSQIN